VLLLLASPSRAQVVAGPITNGDNGHNYYLLAQTNWNAGEAQAIALGGHLATIRNADENAWVLLTFAPIFGNADLFIGLTDRAHEDTFVWISGETNSYRHWKSGEPNNAGGNEDRVAIDTTNGRWNDVPGTHNGHFCVVETLRRQTNGVPTVTIARPALPTVEISWPSATGRLYQVLSAPSLTTENWSSFGPYLYGDGATLHVTDTIDQTRKFYRVDPVE
jgi:hypothetical protein